MNAIFLDIDGVLNSYGTTPETESKSRCGNYIGIDKDKVKRLAKVVKETDAILILTSSWKIGWEPKNRYNIEPIGIYDKSPNYHAKYLDNHLKKKGKLILKDKTRERNLNYRGSGIKVYLTQHPDITNWIVLDDEIFIDFKEQGILPHLLQIDALYGLTDNDAEIAIKMLKGQIQGPYKGGPHKPIFNSSSLDVILEKEAGPANKEV